MSTLSVAACSPHLAVPFPESLAAVLPDAASKHGDRPALFFEGNWSSFRELDRDSTRFADGLVRHGVGPKSRVILHAPNSREWIVAYFGAAKAGAVIVPLDFMLTPDEITFIANDCGASVLVSGMEDTAAIEQIRAATSISTVILTAATATAPDVMSQEELIQTGSDLFKPMRCEPDELASISYTAGTTGKPKGVMLTNHSILLSAALTAEAHARTADDVFLSALPCTHVYGNAIVHASLLVGGRFVLLRRFDSETALASIEAHRVTLFEGVPTMYLRILSHSRREKHDLRSLTRCTVGGQAIPVEKIPEAESLLGCPLVELWGMTELAGPAITHWTSAPGPHGSIGRPLPGMEVRLDANDDTRSDGESGIGELCVRGPLVMKGYLNRPEITAQTIDSEGWLHTGDLATIDSSGNVFIVGRTKDTIITAGYNIYPTEVERAIARHPAVAMVAVGQATDPEKGEIAVAYVVAKPGHVALAGEIEQVVRERLAPYKIPRRIVFVEDLPKTGSGKIMRNRLHEAKPIADAPKSEERSQYRYVKTEISNHVGIVTMHGPKGVNALNEEMILEIGDALHSLDNNPEVRCLILRAGTDKYFSVGADINEMALRSFSAAMDEDFFTVGWARISQCRKPLIAAVSGLALGGGCELALMCDVIVASETAEFGLPEVRLGIFPGAGGTQRLIRQIGKSKAMEIILTGQVNLTAVEALASGLAARVVPVTELEATTLDMANKISVNSTLIVRMAKESINRAYESSLAEGLLFERRLFYAALATEDKSEGTKAFLERRQPFFQNR